MLDTKLIRRIRLKLVKEAVLENAAKEKAAKVLASRAVKEVTKKAVKKSAAKRKKVGDNEKTEKKVVEEVETKTDNQAEGEVS